MYPSNIDNTGCIPPYFLIPSFLHNGNGQRNITLSNSDPECFKSLVWCNNQDFSCLLKDCGHWIKPNQTKLTWVFPPVLSCTALLERAVLAAKDLKEAPKMLLTPKAISSCSQVRQIVARYHNLGEWCTLSFPSIRWRLPGFHRWCSRVLQNRLLPRRMQQQTPL